jgi:transposase
MSKTRRNHGSAFKAKVALEALKGEQTVAEIAAKLHPTLVTEWKRQLVDGASAVFDKGTGQAEKAGEALVGELYRQIGQQKVELDFLARKLGR